MPSNAKRLAVTAVSVFLVGGVALAQTQDQTQTQTQDQPRTQQQIRDRDIYGYQLMTPEERAEYRTKMRAAKTAEEREQTRAEHYEQMQARAKERGMSLPDEPRRGAAGSTGPRGPGAGGGPGMGGGPGAGRRY